MGTVRSREPFPVTFKKNLAARQLLEPRRGQREQLAGTQARVGQDADEQLVPLGRSGVLHALDCVAGEHVDMGLLANWLYLAGAPRRI